MTLLASYVPGTMNENGEDVGRSFFPFLFFSFNYYFLLAAFIIFYYLISTSLESIALQIPVVVLIDDTPLSI